MGRIPRIGIPTSSVINRIPPPVVQNVPPPVVSGIEVPVINVPNPVIDYPTLDVPTEEQFRQSVQPEEEPAAPVEDTRDLQPPAPPQPTINVGGFDVPLPEPGPLMTTGATAVVATTVTLGSTILFNKIKSSVLEPMVKRMGRKKKIKIKQIKPVLHFVLDDDGQVDIYEYSHKGTKLLESVDNVERYLRDQVEMNSLYEYDNKIIIDENIKEGFTKEGTKRFKALFTPPAAIAKKLASKFAF